MWKVEILLNGPEEEQCAELISDLAHETMRHFNVVPVRTYCGRAPVKAGAGELLVPDFMKCRAVTGKKKPYPSGGKAVPHEG